MLCANRKKSSAPQARFVSTIRAKFDPKQACSQFFWSRSIKFWHAEPLNQGGLSS